MATFTKPELDYLSSQRLGRLATVDGRSAPQNNPVGFSVTDDGTVEIGGWNMGRTRKFKNVRGNGQVSLVVDDLASVNPWKVRGVEIRGHADAVTGLDAGASPMSGERIRIHPDRIISWGLEEGAPA